MHLKRSIVTKIVVILLVFSLLSISPIFVSNAQADDPVVPHSIYGEVQINGKPAPGNITIIAKINGEEEGNITTLQPSSYGSKKDIRYLDIRGESDDVGKEVELYVKDADGELIQASNVEPNLTFTPKGFEEIDIYFDDVNLGSGLPTVNTDPAGNVYIDGAQLSCNINYDQYSDGEISFYYREKGEQYWQHTDYEATSKSYYSYVLNGLKSSTTYQFFPHYRLEGLNDTAGDGVCGELREFTTEDPEPSVKTLEPAEVTRTSALLKAEVDLSTYTEVDIAFFYRKLGGNWKDTGFDTIRTESYSYQLKNLESGEIYEYYAKIKYDSKEKSGSAVQFKTVPTEPEVKTAEAEDIDVHSATVKANVDLGSYENVDIQFFYSKSGGAWKSTGFETISTSSYQYELINMESNTTYEFYASILYGENEKHGSTKTFTTSKSEPTIDSLTSSEVTNDSAQISVNIAGNDYGKVELKYHWKGQGLPMNESEWVDVGDDGEQTYSIQNLQNNTLYEYYVALRFDSETIESSHLTFQTSDTENINPTASFVLNNNEPSVNEEIVMDASSSEAEGQITDYSWSIDGGNELKGKSVSYTFANSGYHTIRLTVTDNDGSTGSMIKNVYVKQVYPAKFRMTSFSVSENKVNPGDEVTFTFRVTNTGGSSGTYETDFKINKVAKSHIVKELEPSGTKKVTIKYTFNSEGEYDYEVGPYRGLIQVEEKTTDSFDIPYMLILSIVVGVGLAVGAIFILDRHKKNGSED